MSLGKSCTQNSFEKYSPLKRYDGSFEKCRAKSPNFCGASARTQSSSRPPVYRCKTHANAESNTLETSKPSSRDVFSSCSTIQYGTENSNRSRVGSDEKARSSNAPSCPEWAACSRVGKLLEVSLSISLHCLAKWVNPCGATQIKHGVKKETQSHRGHRVAR